MSHYDVIDAKILEHLVFWVKFADGVAGNVVIHPAHLIGVFKPLADPDFFNRLEIQNGFVAWGEDIDLAPDAMHDAIQQHGQWVLA
jgi:hypothetical protein